MKEVPIIGPNPKRFKREIRARLSNPTIRQALLVTRSNGGDHTMVLLNLDETVSHTIALLEWAKLNVFENWVSERR